MKKTSFLLVITIMAITLLVGCLNSAPPTPYTSSSTSASPSISPSTSPSPSAQGSDAVSSASPKESSNPADIVNGLSAKGYWIFSVLSDVTINETLNVDGVFHKNDDAKSDVYRKFALYAQDDKRNVTANYTVTVPLINVTTPNFRIQQGTVKGNVHVNAEGFEIVKCTIDGNLTFETQAQMDSAKLEDGTVTGTVSVGAATDAVSSASPKESSNPADIVNGLSAKGYWIFSVLSDVTINETLNVDGQFYKNDDAKSDVYRKFALYAQDDKRNVTANYTVTVPLMNVTTPNFRIQQGTVKGNVHVNAEGFEIVKCTIDGNLTFETQAQMDSAKLEDGTVTGTVSVGAATDAVSSASPKESSNPADIVNGLSAKGYWIFSVLSDVTIKETLNVDGVFYKNDDSKSDVYRKFALYAQDDKRNVTANYTVTVPQMNVTTPNFRIQQGTIKGNVHVNAEGFEIVKCTIDGNLTFETQAQMDSAKLGDGTVTGKVSVK